MDGNDPELSGDLDQADLPGHSRPGRRTRVDSRIAAPHTAASQSNLPQPPLAHNPSPFPIADWKLFAGFQLEGENASFALLDGTGCFIDDATGKQTLWGTSGSALKGQSIADLISESPNNFLEWLLDLNPESADHPFSTVFSNRGSPDRAVQLKRLPLFISSDPGQTRIVVKAAPAPQTAERPRQPCKLESEYELDGTFKSANSSWTHSLEYAEEELVEHSLRELIHPSDHADFDQFLAKLNAIGGPCRELLRIQSKAGRFHSFLVRGERSFDGKSLQISAKEIGLDSQDPISGLLGVSAELVNESVLLLSQDQRGYSIRYANRAFEDSTGCQASDILGKSIADIESKDADLQIAGDIESAISHDETLRLEFLLKSVDAAPIATRARFLPLRDDRGCTRFYAAIFEDLTKEKAVANELEAKNRELSEALLSLEETQKTVIQQENLRALGQMASGIAHDFNNLLAPILGFSELLLNMPADARDNEKLESFLKKIRVAAQDGAAVVSRLREFYRAHNREESENALIDPAALIDQVKDLTKHRWKTQSEANGIDIRFDTVIRSKRRIRGNEPELRQSLANIVINAVDAIQEDGAIRIVVDDSHDRLRIRVKDTGNGMPRHIQEKCLDPFYTTKGQLGTGLGLSIVCGIVKRHGGEFAIDSIEGEGTTIDMSFPAVDATEPTELEDVDSNVCEGSLRIMLVDDEDILLEVISELLASSGHVVDTFSSPESALKQFSRKNYDLVMTDRAMPHMSGDQLAAAIKSEKPDTPVYLMTGFGDLIKEFGETPANIDDVLGKPVPLEALNRKLSELVASKNAN